MKIEKLIEKYYEAESSTDEEMLLHEHFKSHASPEKAMLDFYSAQSEITLSSDFDSKILEIIEQDSNFSNKISRHWQKYIAIAASVALVIGSTWYLSFYSEQTNTAIVINDDNLNDNKDLAMAELSNAFSMMSESFDTADENLRSFEQINKSYELFEMLNFFGTSN